MQTVAQYDRGTSVFTYSCVQTTGTRLRAGGARWTGFSGTWRSVDELVDRLTNQGCNYTTWRTFGYLLVSAEPCGGGFWCVCAGWMTCFMCICVRAYTVCVLLCFVVLVTSRLHHKNLFSPLCNFISISENIFEQHPCTWFLHIQAKCEIDDDTPASTIYVFSSCNELCISSLYWT